MSGEGLGPINAALCRSRWNSLYKAWDELDQLKECDAIMVLTGQPKGEDDLFKKLGAFHLWSFMLIFPDTLLVLFKDRRLIFAGRARKLKYFNDLQNSEMAKDFKFELYQREPKQTDNMAEHFKECGLLSTFQILKASDDAEKPLRIGTFLGPSCLPQGPTAEAIMTVLGFPAHGLSDLNPDGTNKDDTSSLLKFRWRFVDDDLSRLPLRLEESVVDTARLAAVAAGRVVKEVVVNRVVSILDQELKESHRVICTTAEDALEDTNRLAKWKTKYGIDGASLELHYCSVESGGQFTLDPDGVPDDRDLHLGRGSITIGLAMKYHNNVGNIARTVLMDVEQPEKDLYTAALDLQDYVIRQIVPGKKFKEVFEAGWSYAQTKHPKLAEYLLPDFGGALGTQLFVSNFKFDATSDQTIDENMPVSVCISAPKIEMKQPIAIWLADTLIVKAREDDTPPVLWTTCCPKKLDDVLYALEGDSKPPEKESRSGAGASGTSSGTAERKAKAPSGPATRVRSRRANAGINQAEQERVLSKQRELRRKKLIELQERFKEGGMGFAKDKKDIRKLSHLTAYRESSEFPKDLKLHKCHIDNARETLLIPIGQRHVPFHVSTLRNVSHQDEDRLHTLRVSFNVPGALSGAKQEESPLPDLSGEENALFIKEIIIKSHDAQLMTLAKNLRDLMKRARTKEKYRREDDVTQQQALALNRTGRRILLRNLMVRHGGAHSRKIIGVLEAHVNGFRYQAIRSESIDIIYSNILHAFFQPVTNEMVVLLHFHLKSPIMVQKKKVKDLQFYCEIASQADDLDARRNRSNNDPDEIFEEQREHEKKKKLNLEFKRFVDQSQEMAPIEFEIPTRVLQFYGVPRNSSVVLTPTQNCLVNLTDWPAFILPMEDVEIVSFERVLHGLKHFDAVFVPKDYGKSVQIITNIPVASLDMLKAWLNDMDIPWYEGKRNLAWAVILKAIRSDIEGFIDDGGFGNFLGEGPTEGKKKKEPAASEDDANETNESAGDDSEDDDEDDEEYQETSSSAGSEDSEGEGSDDDADEGSDDDEDGSDDDEEEGSDEEGSDEDDEEEDESDEEEKPQRKRKSNTSPSTSKAADSKRRRQN